MLRYNTDLIKSYWISIVEKILQKPQLLCKKTTVCINDIRNFPEIKELLKTCEGFGRTWGRKGSYYYGSHIAFIRKEAIVLLIQGKKKAAESLSLIL